MPRQMPLDDFRAVRTVLEADDFAYAPGDPNPPPEDLVDKATWGDLVTLPDTVAIFTSNNHGGSCDSRLTYGESASNTSAPN